MNGTPSLGPGSRRSRWRRLSRFQLFLLGSAVLISAAIASATLLVGPFFERYILAREQDHMALHVTEEAQEHLTLADFDPLTTRAGVFHHLLSTLPAVSGLTGFDRAGRTVWSSDERQIGRLVTDDKYLARALSGEVASVLQGDNEHTVRTYVPVMLPESEGLTGVIQTSKAFTQVVLGIRHTQRLILAVAAAVGLVLYVGLGFLASRASQIERRSITRLEAQNRDLMLIQQFTHSLLAPPDPGQLASRMVQSIGTGLGFSRASLCRVSEKQELSLIADWKGPGAGAWTPPHTDVVREAINTRRAIVSAATAVVPLFVPSNVPGRGDVSRPPSTYLFVGASGQSLHIPPMLFNIMLDEAAIALAHAGLFTAIREAHEHLAAILAGIADRMVILDRELNVVWMNGVATEIYGPRLGLPCVEMPGAGKRCEECPAVRTFRTSKVERGMRAERLPCGGVRHLDLVTAPLLDCSGSVRQVIEVARDITDLVELEERLRQSAVSLEESHGALLIKTRELEAANRALGEAQDRLVEKERLEAAGEVVVGLHHSILNPLAGIFGALQLLKQDELTAAERQEAFGQAEAEIHKIEQIVRGLSSLRRVSGIPYVGKATMLDLERSCREEEPF